MRKVLFLTDLNPNKFGSLEEMILLLGRELSRRGNTLVLGTIAYPIPPVAELFLDAGIQLVNLNRHGEMNAARRLRSVRALIREQRIDLVHINFYGLTDPVALGAYLTPASIVYTEHASGAAPRRGALKNALSRLLHFFIGLRVEKYIAVSNFVRERLRITHHVGPGRIVTIYNGVNVARFAPQDRATARRRTGLPLGGKIVLSVAMLIPEKGISTLLQAASILVTEFKTADLSIVIVGEGSCREALEREVTALQLSAQVTFLGRRSDVDLLVAAADLVAVPALWAESFGLIIAEAMAGGRPVVASRVGGIPELVEAGKTGLLVEPGDGPGLAQAINRLLTDDPFREQLVQNALCRVQERFNLARQTAELADLYDQIQDKHFSPAVKVTPETNEDRRG